MVRGRWAVVLFLLAGVAEAQPAKVVFERLLPAAADLGPVEDVAIVAAPARGEPLEVFVASFVAEVNQSRTLRGHDLRQRTGHADGRLEVAEFTCTASAQQGEGSSRDEHGNRVRRPLQWVDATCTARLAVLAPKSKSLEAFSVRGDGTSPRVDKASEDERAVALRQAARYAGIEAAGRVTPRLVRESILLEEGAAAFAEGVAMIESQRLKEARTIWENRLKRNPGDAALHFNLGALCEALGDRVAAEHHYTAARDLAPDHERYVREIRAFNARGGS